jgi:hypothetical protein
MIWTCSKNDKRKVTKRSYDIASTWKKETRKIFTWGLGIKGLKGEKGLV